MVVSAAGLTTIYNYVTYSYNPITFFGIIDLAANTTIEPGSVRIPGFQMLTISYSIFSSVAVASDVQ